MSDFLPSTTLSYAAYAEIPADGQRWEFLDGEVFVTPAPSPAGQNPPDSWADVETPNRRTTRVDFLGKAPLRDLPTRNGLAPTEGSCLPDGGP